MFSAKITSLVRPPMSVSPEEPQSLRLYLKWVLSSRRLVRESIRSRRRPQRTFSRNLQQPQYIRKRRGDAASIASAWCTPRRCPLRESSTIWELRNLKNLNHLPEPYHHVIMRAETRRKTFFLYSLSIRQKVDKLIFKPIIFVLDEFIIILLWN